MNLGTITINLSDDTIQKITSQISENISTGVQEMTNAIVKAILGGMHSVVVNNPVEEVSEPQLDAPVEVTERMKLIQTIYDTLHGCYSLIDTDFGNIDEVNSIVSEEISKITDGIIKVCFSKMRGSVCPNFRETECMRAIHQPKWNGRVKWDNVIPELTEAYNWFDAQKTVKLKRKYTRTISSKKDYEENKKRGLRKQHVPEDNFDSTTLITKGKRGKRSHGYTQESYQRVKTNSNIIRFRRAKNSNYNGPMVIDRSLASDLVERHLTHATLMESNQGSLCIVFEKEDKPTRAPHNSKTISRLHVYGINKNNNMPTTYSINSRNFQNTIMKHFGLSLGPGGETTLGFTVLSDKKEQVIVKLIKEA